MASPGGTSSATAPPSELFSSPSDFAAFIKHCGTASKVLTAKEKEDCRKLADIIKEYMWSGARSFVQESGDRPILYVYGSDGTPTTIQHQFRVSSGSHSDVVRVGGQAEELLLQKGYLIRKSFLGEVLSIVS